MRPAGHVDARRENARVSKYPTRVFSRRTSTWTARASSRARRRSYACRC